jgi:hypothetical protein
MKRNGDASKAFARKEKWFGEFSFSTKYDLEVMGGREADRIARDVRSKLMSPVRHEELIRYEFSIKPLGDVGILLGYCRSLGKRFGDSCCPGGR